MLQEFSWRFKFLRRKDPRLDCGRAYAKAVVAQRIAQTGAETLPDVRPGRYGIMLWMPP